MTINFNDISDVITTSSGNLNSANLVSKGSGTNFLLQSSALTNAAWSNTNITITGSQSDPFGNTNAVLLNDGGVTGQHYFNQFLTLNSNVYNFSVYAKAGTANYVGLFVSVAGQGAFFNLTTGAFSANLVGAPTAYSITNAGNGWYRCSITITTTSSNFNIYISEDGTNFSFAGTNKTIYISSPQVEIGSVTNPYVATTSSAIYGPPTLSFNGVAGLNLTSNGALNIFPAGTGNVNINATTTNLSNNVYIGGTLTVVGNTNIQNVNVTQYNITTNDSLYITNTTPSISNTTGALTVAGGAGISGNLYSQQIFTTGGAPGVYNETNSAGVISGNLYYNNKIFFVNNSGAQIQLNHPGSGWGTITVPSANTFGLSSTNQTVPSLLWGFQSTNTANGFVVIPPSSNVAVQNTASLALTVGGTIGVGAGSVSSPAISLSSSNRGIFDYGGGVSIVGAGWEQARFGTATSTVNYLTFSGSPTGNTTVISTGGTDANVSIALQAKGTGNIDFLSNVYMGGISNTSITFIIRNSSGSGYTSTPTLTISPPTSPNGTQATANISMSFNGATIVNGGTGYSVNDTLTAVGGSISIGGGGPLTAKVTSVAANGAITGVSTLTFGGYGILPALPFSVTGGTGTSATFTSTAYVGGFTVTNGGSGYIDPPTITLSGGGTTQQGIASAVVGNTAPKISTLYTSLSFATPSGEALRVSDPYVENIYGGPGPSTVNYVEVIGGQSNYTYGPIIRGSGADTNITLSLASKGSGGINFYTRDNLATYYVAGSQQFAITDNASAVNYLSVTGATTGNSPTLSSQGSDSTVSLNLLPKGNGTINLGGQGNPYVLQVVGVASGSNYNNFGMKNGVGGSSSPILYSWGVDTNININYQTKGTGSHVFQTGTYSNTQFVVADTANAVNYVQVTGGITGNAATISAKGSDTNIDLALTPKGTGALVAQASDGGVTINARGANAVDLSTNRANPAYVAIGQYSVIGGGTSNFSAGQASVVGGGTFNYNSGNQGFVGGGQGNNVNGNFASVVGGYTNTAGGFYNFIGGGYTNTGSNNAAVTTQSANLYSNTVTTLSTTNSSIKVGQYISGTSIPFNTYVAAISGTTLTLSQNALATSNNITLSFYTPHAVVVGGGNNQATGSYSFIGGGGDAGTAANGNKASGDWSFVGGGFKNTASGKQSFIGNGDNGIASGAWSSVLNGSLSNQASGTYSNVLNGTYNIASGTYSTIINGSGGAGRGLSNYTVFAGIFGSAIGDTQAGLMILKANTSDATPTVLTVNNSAAGTTNQIILPNNSAYAFKGQVVANVTGAAGGAGWDFKGVIMRGAAAANTYLVGTPIVDSLGYSANAANWLVSLSADTTNGGLAVTVTGTANTTIRWVAKVETTEVTF